MALDTPNDWVVALVEVLKDYGRPMPQDELIKMVAKIVGVMPIRLHYALRLAENDGLILIDSKTNKVLLT